MSKFLKALVNPALNCPFCGTTKTQLMTTGICAECSVELIKPIAPYCETCHKVLATDSYKSSLDAAGKALCADCLRYPNRHFTTNRSAFLYNDFARDLIELYKYFGKESLATPLARLLAETYQTYYQTNDQLHKIDLITAVPLHESRLRIRSFNQSRLLAVKLSRLTGLDYQDLLVKKKATHKLSHGSRSERFRQLAGAFELARGFPQGSRILLIDDIYTTGATAEQAASTLIEAGAGSVKLLTLARAYDRNKKSTCNLFS